MGTLCLQRTTILQFECCSYHGCATAEAVVIGVGVDTVEDGVGVAALVQEIGEFQTEDALFVLVLRRGVEEGHALVLVGGNLAAHMVIVQGEAEGGDGENVDGSAVGEGGYCIAFLGVVGARPAVADVVAQFSLISKIKPRECPLIKLKRLSFFFFIDKIH